MGRVQAFSSLLSHSCLPHQARDLLSKQDSCLPSACSVDAGS